MRKAGKLQTGKEGSNDEAREEENLETREGKARDGGEKIK